MTDELTSPGNEFRDRDSLDEPLTSLVREAYSPPGGDTYWAQLEERIMSRVASTGRGSSWWTVLAPYARPALIAAAVIFALAGLVSQRLLDIDADVAYDSVIQSVTPDVVATSEELASASRGTDGATLRYFLSH